MSRRTAKANEAIKKAWEREQALVRDGKGTRDWTPEQQKDILDENKGKAYDDKGRAFEGQHMKSVAEYPTYQGNPDNIQFLSKEEHLAAHKGNWKNSTNWYYNPETKEYFEFMADEIRPCKTINLSNPIVTIHSGSPCTSNEFISDNDYSDLAKEKLASQKNENELVVEKKDNIDFVKNVPAQENLGFFKKIGKKLKDAVPRAKQVLTNVTAKPMIFAQKHPRIVTALSIVGGVFITTITKNNSNSTDREAYNQDSSISNKVTSNNHSIDFEDEDSTDEMNSSLNEETSAEHSSPREHIVSAHGQHYHTKDGVIWKDKNPYPRGGNKDEE